MNRLRLDQSKIVAREGAKLLRRLARWGLALAIAVATVPSAAYMTLAIHHEGEDFEGALDRRAVVLSRHAYASGPLWRFEVHRITDQIEPLRSEIGTSIYRVEVHDGDAWIEVAAVGTQPAWPTITRSADVVDGDRVVGRIVGAHEISHALEMTGFVVMASVILGLGVLLLLHLRAIPFLRTSLDKLERHEQDLAAERAQLERLVAARTAELTDANARLESTLAREREINHQQRRFVSVVSHEFRTPLTIIDGAAQRLARNAGRMIPAELHERVERIRRAVARMSELIETSLSAARVDSGAVTMARTRVALPALLQGICERIRSIAPEFEIALEGVGQEIEIEGDPRLLDQVFTNLMTNAVKYSGASRRIAVEFATGGGEASIAVRDHGLGIPADEVPKLFERFYRASTAQGLPGTGIGLNLARELVTMHGGRIEVASEVGRGTTFTVHLPRIAPATSTADAVQAA